MTNTTTPNRSTVQKGHTMTENTTTQTRTGARRFIPTRKGLIGTAAAAAILGSASFTIAPAINASPVAQQAGISVPADGAEAATRYPLCNRTGVPIKWGHCYSYERAGWSKGHTYWNAGAKKNYTYWYSQRRHFWNGIYLGIERDGDWVTRPSYLGAPNW